MQTQSNSDQLNNPSEKRKGVIGTLIIHIALLALLFLVGITIPEKSAMEGGGGGGILVNFGTGETGLGLIEPSSDPSDQEEAPLQSFQDKAPLPSKSTPTKTQEDEPLITQNNEEAPAVKKVDPAKVKKVDPDLEKKKLEKVEADKKVREQIEAERKIREQEELERKKAEAEQKRQSDIMNRTRNAFANSKNTGTGSKSEGIAGGTGNQGVPTGSVDSKIRGYGTGLGTGGTGTGSGTGNGSGSGSGTGSGSGSGFGNGNGNGSGGVSYSLQGRGSKSLPVPKYDYQGEGRVVVEVSVDRSGKVIQAIPGIKGSTTLDDYLLKVAKDAALKARFDVKQDAPVTQKGTITYNFILK